MYTILFTDQAEIDLDRTVDFIGANWLNSVKTDFLASVSDKLKRLETNLRNKITIPKLLETRGPSGFPDEYLPDPQKGEYQWIDRCNTVSEGNPGSVVSWAPYSVTRPHPHTHRPA